MNKKILAILMAMLMIAMSAVAFATVEDAKGNQDQLSKTPTAKDAITIKKIYSGAGRPAETFTFKVYTDPACEEKDLATGFGDSGQVTIEMGAGETTENAPYTASETADLTLPGVGNYSEPGEYVYYLKEIEGNYAGVEYSGAVYKLTVTVYTEKDASGNLVYKRTVSIRDADSPANKYTEATFNNTYDSTSMTVKKVLAGNMANMNDTFKFTVTFKNPSDTILLKSAISGVANDTAVVVEGPSVATDGTVTFKLSGMGHNDEVTFTNLPVGTIYSVVEDPQDKYEVDYSDKDKKENQKVVLANADTKVVVTNTKDENIDTGVTTDNMPYIMLMAFAMMIAAAVLLKKRTVNE